MGTVCHFQHRPLKEMEELAAGREKVWIVETVNWTLADEETVHFNKFYEISLSSALSLANRIEVSSRDVSEEVLCVRLASAAEASLFLHVYDHFDRDDEDIAISEDQASALGG